MEACEIPEISEYGFDVANFVSRVNLYYYRESVGISRTIEVMLDVVDLEGCEPTGRC